MLMEYTVTTNKNELNLIEHKYYEICLGIFKKVFWGENSLFISDDLFRIVEDIISNAIVPSRIQRPKMTDFKILSK